MFSGSTFKTYRQYDQMDCGPTCLRMVARHHGRSYTMETLRNRSGINREGVSLLGMVPALEYFEQDVRQTKETKTKKEIVITSSSRGK